MPSQETFDNATAKLIATTTLDVLGELYALRDKLTLDKQELREQVLTPEIKQKLVDIDLEFAAQEGELADKIALAESEARTLVLACGETINGEHLQAVWKKGRVSWETKWLEGYATAHPEILAFKKEGEPSVSICKR